MHCLWKEIHEREKSLFRKGLVRCEIPEKNDYRLKPMEGLSVTGMPGTAEAMTHTPPLVASMKPQSGQMTGRPSWGGVATGDQSR